MQNKNILYWILVFVFFNLSSCANTQVASTAAVETQSIQEAEKASSNAITPESAISDAEAQLKDARNENLEFYSPLHIAQAVESIDQAKKYLKKPPKKIKNAALMSAIAAKTFISKAYENKLAIEGNLKKALAHHRILVELNSPVDLPEDYQDVLSELTSLVKLVERGKFATAIDKQDSLLDKMAVVEIDTLIKQHLTKAENFLEKAEDVDADDYAELSYEKAEKTIENANKFIHANYRDRKGVTNAGIGALKAAQHAYFIALEVKKRINMNANDTEQFILDLVSAQNKLYYQAYNHKLDPQSFTKSQEALFDMVKDLSKKLQQAENYDEEQARAASIVRSKMNSKASEQSLEISTDTEISVIKTLPLDSQIKEEYPAPLRKDEQLFDSVETLSQ